MLKEAPLPLHNDTSRLFFLAGHSLWVLRAVELTVFAADADTVAAAAAAMRQLRQDAGAAVDELLALVAQIVPYHMTHNAEPEAVDLLLEVGGGAGGGAEGVRVGGEGGGAWCAAGGG